MEMFFSIHSLQVDTSPQAKVKHAFSIYFFSSCSKLPLDFAMYISAVGSGKLTYCDNSFLQLRNSVVKMDKT